MMVQMQETLARIETRLTNLENNRREDNHRADGGHIPCAGPSGLSRLEKTARRGPLNLGMTTQLLWPTFPLYRSTHLLP